MKNIFEEKLAKWFLRVTPDAQLLKAPHPFLVMLSYQQVSITPFLKPIKEENLNEKP